MGFLKTINKMADIKLEREALERAEVVYKRITGYVPYESMNGIPKQWFIEKIAEGIQDAHPEKFYLGKSIEKIEK